MSRDFFFPQALLTFFLEIIRNFLDMIKRWEGQVESRIIAHSKKEGKVAFLETLIAVHKKEGK